MGFGIPDYKNLDLSGEAEAAARNMEDRAREPASQALFDSLVGPLIAPDTRVVLEVGCGTGALAARIADYNTQAYVLGTDKSEGMIRAARGLRASEGERQLSFELWDVTDPGAALSEAEFDLIASSVVIPYLTGEQTVDAVERFGGMLSTNGILAFFEQDIDTLEVTAPFPEFGERIARRTRAALTNPYLGLGLLPVLEEAGLETMPVESFAWTDRTYCPYVRRLLERTAKDLVKAGDASDDEATAWLEGIAELAARGEFLYSLTYRRIAGIKT